MQMSFEKRFLYFRIEFGYHLKNGNLSCFKNRKGLLKIVNLFILKSIFAHLKICTFYFDKQVFIFKRSLEKVQKTFKVLTFDIYKHYFKRSIHFNKLQISILQVMKPIKFNCYFINIEKSFFFFHFFFLLSETVKPIDGLFVFIEL